jgi:hypothetical protein
MNAADLANILKRTWNGLTPRLRLAVKAVVFGVALIAAALAFLPEAGLRWGLSSAMQKLGMTETHLARADIALFDGRLVIRSFQASPKIGQALGLDRLDFSFRWLPLLKREVSVESLDLGGLSIDLQHEGDKLIVNGAAIDLKPGSNSSGSVWNFDISALNLTDSQIDLATQKLHLRLHVDLLELRNLKSLDPKLPASFRFKGSIDGGSFDIAGTALPFDARPSFQMTVATQELDLSKLAPMLAVLGIDNASGLLNADLSLAGDLDKIEGKGSLGSTNLKASQAGSDFEVGGLNVRIDRLAWKANPLRLDYLGRLESGQARITLPATRFQHKAATLEGTFELSLDAKDDLLLSSNLALTADQLLIQDTASQSEVLNAPRLNAGSIRLDNARLGSAGDIAIDALLLNDLDVKIARSPSGETPPKPQTNKAGGEPPSPRLALDRFAIGGKSRLEFSDRTPSQPVGIVFDRLKLSMSNLDSRRPGEDSPFEIEAKAGNASLSIKGQARPFAQGITARFATQVKAFELPPLSPYAADALGVELQTGHFDGELTLRLDNGDLDGKLDLALSNLYAAQPDPNAPLAKQAGMPVALVLDLLRDGEDRIRLSIPLGGNLADPQFDLSDAMSKAIGGALRGTAMTTLKVVFPVLLLIDGLSDQGAPALAPVGFAPGGETIEADAESRLDIIGKLMRERPGLKLSLCPASVPTADWPVLLERQKKEELGLLYKMQKMVNLEAKPEKVPPDPAVLTALSESRAAKVKSLLADKSGIDPGRLFLCRPKIDSDAKAQPRVDLVL